MDGGVNGVSVVQGNPGESRSAVEYGGIAEGGAPLSVSAEQSSLSPGESRAA